MRARSENGRDGWVAPATVHTHGPSSLKCPGQPPTHHIFKMSDCSNHRCSFSNVDARLVLRTRLPRALELAAVVRRPAAFGPNEGGAIVSSLSSGARVHRNNHFAEVLLTVVPKRNSPGNAPPQNFPQTITASTARVSQSAQWKRGSGGAPSLQLDTRPLVHELSHTEEE